MTKIKMLFGLTVMAALLAISAAPASAEFEATGAKTTGVSKDGPQIFLYGKENLKFVLSCERATDEWKVRKKEPKQEETKKGGRLNILITKWENCKTTFEGATTEIGACEFQLEQEAGNLTALFSVLTNCLMKVKLLFTCEIAIEATTNKALGKVKLSTIGASNSLNKLELSGINEKANSECKPFGLTAPSTTGETKSEQLEEGVKVV